MEKIKAGPVKKKMTAMSGALFADLQYFTCAVLTLTQSTTFIVSCTRRLETWDSTVVVYAPSLFDKQLVAAVELPANLLSQPLAQLTESYQHPKDALTINFQSAKNTPAKASAMGSKQQRLCRTKLNFSVVGDTGNLRKNG